VQSVPITIKVVSLNPIYGDVYLIQHHVIKFVSGLQQVGGFLSRCDHLSFDSKKTPKNQLKIATKKYPKA
jgi:hypothetical protein